MNYIKAYLSVGVMLIALPWIVVKHMMENES